MKPSIRLSPLFASLLLLSLSGVSHADLAAYNFATLNELPADEYEQLNAELFMLALGHKGLAGGKTGMCVDYVPGIEPKFKIAIDTDQAFATGKYELQALKDGFDPAKMRAILAFFQEYRTKSLGLSTKDALGVTIDGYADPQHYEQYRGSSGTLSVAKSVQENRILAANRAGTVRNELMKDPQIMAILNAKIEGHASEKLERAHQNTKNGDLSETGVPLLACDTRRKVVITANVAPAAGAQKEGTGTYRPPHALAEKDLRNQTAVYLNGKFREFANQTDPSLGRETRAILATQKLLESDPKVPAICRQEPLLSLITLHMMGVITTESKRRVKNAPIGGDNPSPEGLGGKIVDNRYVTNFSETTRNDYDIHRHLLAIRAVLKIDFEAKNGRAPTDPELSKLVADPAAVQNASARLVLSREGQRRPPPNPAFYEKVAVEVRKMAADQSYDAKGPVWSIGGGTAGFQCFDIRTPVAGYLKGSKGKSETMKSGRSILKEHSGSAEIEVEFDPHALAPVKPVGDRFDITGDRGPLKGLVCRYCGMGLRFDEKTGKAQLFDRSLGGRKQDVLGNLQAYSGSGGRAFSWGSLMVPMTYVVQDCADCECADLMDRVAKCDPSASNGVTRCADGVTRLNPIEKEDSMVSAKFTRAQMETACVFTPPSFHSCGVSPEGYSSDGKTAITRPKFDFFDPVLMKYVSQEASNLGALKNALSTLWSATCPAPGMPKPAARSPQQIIDDVKCKGSSKGSFPTDDEELDCPHLAKKPSKR